MGTRMIHIDNAFLRKVVEPKKLASLQPRLAQAQRQLAEGTCPGSEFLGWRDLPLHPDVQELARLQKTAKTIREEADALIVVGIGGSYLGTRAAIDFLTPALSVTKPRILYFGHHLDSDYAADILEQFDPHKVFINVISKSGGTLEPAVAFRLLRDRLSRVLDSATMQNRIIATTDPDSGLLCEMAKNEKWTTFHIPPNVGGRFSVMTSVGLLPIAVAGLKIDALLEGARDMAKICRASQDMESNHALLYAALRTLFYESGKRIELMAAFHPALHSVMEWWKQLFGESEGKDGKGLFPASVDFTTDLHSLGQYIQDGSRTMFETILWLEKTRRSIAIPESTDNSDHLNDLAGKTLQEINEAAFQGTAKAHSDGDVPVVILRLQERSEYALGQLFYFFEYAVAISALMLGVNPFDQPGVTTYKNNMKKLLNQK